MFHIYGYFDNQYTGLAESVTASKVSDLPDIVWAYLQRGHLVEVVNTRNGKSIRFNRDKLPYETLEYGLDVSDFKSLMGSAKKSASKNKAKSPIQELNNAFTESKKKIRM